MKLDLPLLRMLWWTNLRAPIRPARSADGVLRVFLSDGFSVASIQIHTMLGSFDARECIEYF